jgi:hypothetical protein
MNPASDEDAASLSVISKTSRLGSNSFPTEQTFFPTRSAGLILSICSSEQCSHSGDLRLRPIRYLLSLDTI